MRSTSQVSGWRPIMILFGIVLFHLECRANRYNSPFNYTGRTVMNVPRNVSQFVDHAIIEVPRIIRKPFRCPTGQVAVGGICRELLVQRVTENGLEAEGKRFNRTTEWRRQYNRYGSRSSIRSRSDGGGGSGNGAF